MNAFNGLNAVNTLEELIRLKVLNEVHAEQNRQEQNSTEHKRTEQKKKKQERTEQNRTEQLWVVHAGFFLLFLVILVFFWRGSKWFLVAFGCSVFMVLVGSLCFFVILYVVCVFFL